MQRQQRVLIATAFAVLAGSGWWLLGHKRAQADPNGQGQTSNRQSVELTVYSEDFAMVHEARPEQMTAGSNHLHLRDVSKLLDPQSVGDFHAYNISKPTTVVQEQMNRLLMLDGKDVPVVKDYSAAMPPISGWDFNEWITPQASLRLPTTATERSSSVDARTPTSMSKKSGCPFAIRAGIWYNKICTGCGVESRVRRSGRLTNRVRSGRKHH